MTLAVNGYPSSSPSPMTMPGVQEQSHPAPSAPIACRKRKDMDDEDSDATSFALSNRRSTMKSLRHFAASKADGDQQAQFLPLPADLNMQVLANLGYMQATVPNALPRDLGSFARPSHSPTSSFSDFGGPSTPSDMAASTESYFSKGMNRESTNAMYPNFNIYPGHANGAPQYTAGLLGVRMNAPSVGSADENGMQMDGMEEQQEPVHGDHCKSIPQLHVRSRAGQSSELWALCPDCGSQSKVEAPPVSDALSYSP